MRNKNWIAAISGGFLAFWLSWMARALVIADWSKEKVKYSGLNTDDWTTISLILYFVVVLFVHALMWQSKEKR